MSPDGKLWDKVKYAAFLLNLANRNVTFDLLYKMFYQVLNFGVISSLLSRYLFLGLFLSPW
jgi:hypothetical protein